MNLEIYCQGLQRRTATKPILLELSERSTHREVWLHQPGRMQQGSLTVVYVRYLNATTNSSGPNI